MRKIYWFLPTFLIIFCALVPEITHAANLFTPIITEGGACNCLGQDASHLAPDWGCILSSFQIVINDLVYFATLLITFYIMWAGFTYITSPTNPENRKKANARILNAVLGLLVILASWLIVDTVMKTLYNPGAGTSAWGPWNDILKSKGDGSDDCIKQQTASTIDAAVNQLGATSNGGGGSIPGSNPSQNARGDCSISGLEADGMSSSIAPTMSCLTKTEDAPCNLGEKSGTDIGTDGQSVSIGMFQINISANDLSKYPACQAVAGNQSLNCTQAFAGGAYTSSNHQTHVINQNMYNTCVKAVSTAACNVQAASDIYNNHGGSKNWGTAAQRNCGG